MESNRDLEKIFFEHLFFIKTRPQMWIWELSLQRLFLFILGISDWLELSWKYIWLDTEFHDFVAQKFWLSSSTMGYTNIIEAFVAWWDLKNIFWEDFLKYHLTQEENEKSIQVFYELLEEFLKEKKIFQKLNILPLVKNNEKV